MPSSLRNLAQMLPRREPRAGFAGCSVDGPSLLRSMPRRGCAKINQYRDGASVAAENHEMDWFSKRPDNLINVARADDRPSVSEISPSLLIGEFPRPEDIPWLKSEFGITAIHNLQDD